VDVPPAGTEAPPEVTEPPAPEPEPEPNPEEITTSEDLEQLIESTDLEEASDSELVSILSSPAFSNIDVDKANEIIDNIEFDELSDAETEQVVQALNAATDEVKQHFENQVNVYSGQFDSYVPAGSAVTVAQRRVLVAVAAATSIAVPTASSSRRRS
jgi:DNA-binding protein YbaB